MIEDSEIFLTAKSVTFSNGQRSFVNDCSFELKKGELINIIGPNGCGKTTIIEGLCGIKNPTSGNVVLKKGIKISYMPQIINIPKNMPITVQYLIKMYAGKQNQDLFSKLKLANILQNQLTSLSGGEIQKVMFYTVITRDSDLFFLDEPENHMDDQSVDAMIQYIKLLLKNKSVVWISHERKKILKESTHILNIHDQVFFCKNHDYCMRKD